MAKTAFVKARVDEDLKRSVEEIFDELGLTMTQAITMFLKGCKRSNGIPFTLEIPNAETRQVFEDTDNGIGLRVCDSVEQLFKELKED